MGTLITAPKRDPESAEFKNLKSTLYSQLTPQISSYRTDVADATNKANSYNQQYNSAYSGLKNLTETGNLPSGLTDSYNQYINRQTQKAVGNAIAGNAARGVINSSVSQNAMNSISGNAADAFAKNFLSAYNSASSNYQSLMNSAQQEEANAYTALNNKYQTANTLAQMLMTYEGLDDYDYVYDQGDSGGK